MNFIKTIVAAGLVAASATAAFAADITGAGATFPFPIYSKWLTPTRRRPATV